MRNYLHKVAQDLGGRATDALSIASSSWCFTYKISLLTRRLWSQRKFREGGFACTGMPGALHPDFQSEAGDPMWTCCLWPETISEPTAPRKQLLSWDAQPESSYTASSTAKVGTLTSLLHSHRQPLHQRQLCLPVLLIFISCWWKTLAWLSWPVFTLMLERWDLSFTLPGQRTCTRTYWEQFKGWRGSLVSIGHSHVGLSVKKAKKSLPSRRGQGARRALI